MSKNYYGDSKKANSQRRLNTGSEHIRCQRTTMGIPKKPIHNVRIWTKPMLSDVKELLWGFQKSQFTTVAVSILRIIGMSKNYYGDSKKANSQPMPWANRSQNDVKELLWGFQKSQFTTSKLGIKTSPRCQRTTMGIPKKPIHNCELRSPRLSPDVKELLWGFQKSQFTTVKKAWNLLQRYEEKLNWKILT